MKIEQYIGIPYCIRNIDGHNCWSFVGLVYMAWLGIGLQNYSAGKGTAAEISACFLSAFATGSHGFHLVDTPADYDVVVFKRGSHFHCGLWWKGKVLHCSQYTNGVSYQDLKTACRLFKVIEFWRL